jgi:CRISPR/Cas system CSM-associated protein Csm3 (group 7 of RAMP superfamily)
MAESYRPYLLEIQGVLSISEFHVGSGARLSILTDAPVLRDAEGRPYIPGSSLRGVLRAHLEREARLLVDDSEPLCRSLFGETPHGDENGGSRAGRLRVFDASIAEDTRAHTDIRDHVRISCRYGAAQSGAKFDQEVAGAARLEFRLVYEGDSAKDGELLLLQEAIRSLESEELSCGAKGGLGYGRIRLEETRYTDFDRTQPESLAAWLNCRLGEPMAYRSEFAWPPATPGDRAIQGTTSQSKLEPYCRLDLALTIHFEGPVLARAPVPPIDRGKAALDANRRDHDVEKGLLTADRAFVRTGKDGAYYLPAASLRGVLRHQAERIATTVLGAPAAAGDLFGEINETSPHKGLIEVNSGKLVGSGKPVYLDHVAIDRITGFAADSRKFATCGLQSPSFETGIRLRFHRQNLHLVALAGFVLRDLLDGMLWCGGGTSRGYGYMKSAIVREAVLDWTPGEEVPPDFLPGATREQAPGRTRVSASGGIPFDSWFWRKAEEAWNQSLPPADGGGHSK